ncbi:uncharacterized protein EI90DRAFT_3019931 [Cantharellus anzutake]|uniref:uncharacterized protein n=1 Tax=Cantharellus anzutake TaxID=1750568 RepID=UPI0019059CE8|nr:uncharacterized protein EI90DRAFT_3019931 [Cantharellus anzutake]KAF8322938.1 hypothetical protein EI90DRAFT_3019931 [Cantharellus anzutake]
MPGAHTHCWRALQVVTLWTTTVYAPCQPRLVMSSASIPKPLNLARMTNWPGSPYVRGGICLPVECLLDTLDSVMFQYLEGCSLPDDYAAWRTPMLAATGSYMAPHQDPHGVGTILHCKAGHKLLFFPINTSQPLIVTFNDIESDGAMGFEYLYYQPHEYSHFILSPGQTLAWLQGWSIGWTIISNCKRVVRRIVVE